MIGRPVRDRDGRRIDLTETWHCQLREGLHSVHSTVDARRLNDGAGRRDGQRVGCVGPGAEHFVHRLNLQQQASDQGSAGWRWSSRVDGAGDDGGIALHRTREPPRTMAGFFSHAIGQHRPRNHEQLEGCS